jgi:hypothetical protein
MTDHDRGYVARRPRHPAAGCRGPCVRVERGAGGEPGPIDAELLDLSRSGARLRVAAPLKVGEAITVRLVDEKSGVELTRPSTVRWQRAEDDQTWSVGCMFTQHVEWETLGELFLNQILSTDRPGQVQ